jgi:hypothetical protein
MKFLLALLLCLPLSVAAETKMYTFGDLKPCTVLVTEVEGKITDERIICLSSATLADQEEWYDFWMKPSTDSTEEATMKVWKWGSTADITTSAVAGVACKGVLKEANPVFAGLGPLGFVAANGLMTWGIHEIHKKKAASTSRYQGSVISAFGGIVRGGAAINNGVLIATHCL